MPTPLSLTVIAGHDCTYSRIIARVALAPLKIFLFEKPGERERLTSRPAQSAETPTSNCQGFVGRRAVWRTRRIRTVPSRATR